MKLKGDCIVCNDDFGLVYHPTRVSADSNVQKVIDETHVNQTMFWAIRWTKVKSNKHWVLNYDSSDKKVTMTPEVYSSIERLLRQWLPKNRPRLAVP